MRFDGVQRLRSVPLCKGWAIGSPGARLAGYWGVTPVFCSGCVYAYNFAS